MERYIQKYDHELDREINTPYRPSVEWIVGDVLKYKAYGIDPLTNKEYDYVFRKIAIVRETGYSWYYPEWEFEVATPSGAENHFMSENSNDPFLENWSMAKSNKITWPK